MAEAGQRARVELGRGIPGLLPWQNCFCAALAGMWGFRFPCMGLVLVLVLLFFCRYPQKLRGRACVLPLFFVLGFVFMAFSARVPSLDAPSWMRERKNVDLTGRVVEVQGRPDRILRVFLADARCRLKDGTVKEVPGLFLWNWKNPGLRPAIGTQVSVRLRVRPCRGYLNPGGWDTRWYWSLQNVFWRGWSRGTRGHPHIGAPAGSVRDRIMEKLRGTDETVSQGRAVLLALLTGNRLSITPDTLGLVRKASLSHALALSGMHLGFAAGIGVLLALCLGRLNVWIFLKIPRQKLAVLLAMPFVAGYMVLGGLTPSLLRAGVMFFSWGVLLLLNRSRVVFDGIFLALLLILLCSPGSLYDIRLQLSVCAVAGIAIFTPLLWKAVQGALSLGRWRRAKGKTTGGASNQRRSLWVLGRDGALGILLMSLSANLVLLPLIAASFGTQAAAFYLNLFCLPFLGFFVIPVGFAGLGLSFLPGPCAPLGLWILRCVAGSLDAALAGLRQLDQWGLLPEWLVLRPSWVEVLGYGLAVLACAYVLGRHRKRALQAACCALVCLVGPALWLHVQDHHRPELRLWLYDLGQSQGACVECPDGRRFLIDGGGGMPGFNLGEVVLAPILTQGRQPRLDAAFLSHADTDHYRGFEYLVQHFGIGAFFCNGVWTERREPQKLRHSILEQGIPLHVVRRGESVKLGPAVRLDVLHPRDVQGLSKNDGSLVLRLVWHGRGLALVPGDIEQKGISELLEGSENLRADVLVVPHHGSKSSVSVPLYERVQPEVAFAAAGFMNFRFYPHYGVRRALGLLQIPLYQSGEHGALCARWRCEHGKVTFLGVATEEKKARRAIHVQRMVQYLLGCRKEKRY